MDKIGDVGWEGSNVIQTLAEEITTQRCKTTEQDVSPHSFNGFMVEGETLGKRYQL